MVESRNIFLCEHCMAFDVVAIGSATIDYFADTDSELIQIDTRTTHESLLAFPLGSKILVKELNMTTGGGGTNTATAFTRLGLNTAFLGKLGDDPAAEFILGSLAKEKIEFLGKQAGKSGISFVLNSIGDDRTILAYKGANDELLPGDIPDFDTHWVYLSSMINQSFTTLVDYITQGSFKVAFNPSSYQAEMGYDKLKPLIDRVSILVMNREEACKLLGLDYHQHSDVAKLTRQLALAPDQTTIITDGAAGAWVFDGEQVLMAKPTPDLDILETTGAGDAFAATFTACKIKGLSTADALEYAMTNAESVLQHKGAKERLLEWQELSNRVASNPRPVERAS